MSSIKELTCLSFSVKHPNIERSWSSKQTTLGKIEDEMHSNDGIIHDTDFTFSPTLNDIVIFLMSSADTFYGFYHNRVFTNIVKDISENIRLECLHELESKILSRREKLLGEFETLYNQYKEYLIQINEHWCNRSLGENFASIAHHFDGLCGADKGDFTPHVTIFGDPDEHLLTLANIFANQKPYVPPCLSGNECSGCKEYIRFFDKCIYCKHIEEAISTLKEKLDHNVSPIIALYPEKEFLYKNFNNTMPGINDIFKLNFSGHTLSLILFLLDTCQIPMPELQGIKTNSECKGVKCVTCKIIRCRVNKYTVEDVQCCINELWTKNY